MPSETAQAATASHEDVHDTLPDNPMERLVAIMAALRHPTDGCPWDVEQTFETIIP